MSKLSYLSKDGIVETFDLPPPASTDRQREEIHAANRKNDRRIAELDKQLALERSVREASTPSLVQRMEHRLLGCKRSAARIRREGQLEKADRLDAWVKEADAALKEYARLQALEASPVVSRLEASAADAGKRLFKSLPGFASEKEATGWAVQFLPFSSERLADVRSNDERRAIAKKRREAQSLFDSCIEKAAFVITGSRSTEAIKKMSDLGAIQID